MLSKNLEFWDRQIHLPQPIDADLDVVREVQIDPTSCFDLPMDVEPNPQLSPGKKHPYDTDMNPVQKLRYRVKLANEESRDALLDAAIIKFKVDIFK